MGTITYLNLSAISFYLSLARSLSFALLHINVYMLDGQTYGPPGQNYKPPLCLNGRDFRE
jgi:hypothetical protein